MSSLSVAMADPKVAFAFEWTREVVEARGWRYEVATEPWAVELGNVRFLSLEAVRKISPPFAGSERRWDPYWLQVRRGETDYNTEEQSGGACVSGRGGVHGDRDRGADGLFQ